MHRLLDLHPRVPGRGDGPRDRRRPDAARRAPGPITRPEPTTGWIPWSAITREALKPTRVSPFEGGWQTRNRPKPWQVWSTMVEPDVRPPAAPCQEACPAGTDAGRYVGLIAQGRYDDAYAVAAEVNPFPSVCGWICTAPCEAACRRGTLDEPIAIRTLKRFAAEHGSLPPVDPPKVRREERVAIVGGGPAGMSAAYYLIRLGYRVTVFEAMPIPGGMMAIGIPEYRLPRETLQAEIERIVGLGVELRLDAVMGRDFTLSGLEQEGFKAIFLATGAPKSRRLGVPGDGSRAASCRPRSSSSRSTSASGRGCPARSSSSGAAARRWTPRGPPCGAVPRPSRSCTGAGSRRCRPRPRRSRPPARRASPSASARS